MSKITTINPKTLTAILYKCDGITIPFSPLPENTLTKKKDKNRRRRGEQAGQKEFSLNH